MRYTDVTKDPSLPRKQLSWRMQPKERGYGQPLQDWTERYCDCGPMRFERLRTIDGAERINCRKVGADTRRRRLRDPAHADQSRSRSAHKGQSLLPGTPTALDRPWLDHCIHGDSR